MTTTTNAPYPARLHIDYPDRELDRVSTLLRIFYVIPIFIVLALISGPYQTSASNEGGTIAAGGVLFLAPLLMILFRQKYPRWWFDWNVGLTKFGTRVWAYMALMNDEYPSTDDEQYVHIELDYPDVEQDLNRWLPLVKWILALPHYIVLVVLALGSILSVIVAWFAVLFTGRYPRALFDFVEGTMRWALRVEAYAFLLSTDQYPPFRLE